MINKAKPGSQFRQPSLSRQYTHTSDSSHCIINPMHPFNHGGVLKPSFLWTLFCCMPALPHHTPESCGLLLLQILVEVCKHLYIPVSPLSLSL